MISSITALKVSASLLVLGVCGFINLPATAAQDASSIVAPAAEQKPADKQLPTLFLVGDSTVKNGTRGQVGWGTPLVGLFDSKKIHVENRALGGRSSRSYIREGLWDKVREALKPGDYVLIQFGHNDNGPLADGKARASLKGTGDEVKEVVLAESGQPETVHSYGWYLRKYIAEAKEKGATPIICSLVPRNMWTDGKVNRAANDFGKWAAESAQQGGALFIDLNAIIAARYDQEGAQKVGETYFTSADYTHTSAEGAKVNAECVVEGIKGLKDCALASYLLDTPKPTSNVANTSVGRGN